MPSVLVELGFLTNNSEEDFLHSNDGQTYMASAIYRAIKEYKTLQQQNKVTSILEEKEKESNNDKITFKGITTEESKDIELPIYKVQIYTAVQEENLPAIEGNPVSFFQEGNLYKFTIGKESTIQAAKKLQILAKKNGFKDAFVIAFYKEKKITLQEAKELTLSK